ncbi:12545_t:CDS:2 [Acaulospora colombiana]|uniref:12545_t:CDS:1 n=1 Tax=Acaulospora colombiana TaxID=27376 RepID=A0ACA9MA72_9GLOM|nr:12545_t:CDS:2 [Acaulospora colombiana]
MTFNGTLKRTFTPWVKMYKGETNFQDVLEDIRQYVDVQCSQLIQPPPRIYSVDQINLRFKASGLPLQPNSLSQPISLVYSIHAACPILMPDSDLLADIQQKEVEPDFEPFLLSTQFSTLKRKASTQYDMIGEVEEKPSLIGNFIWLHDELRRAVLASKTTELFVQKAKMKKTSIHVLIHEKAEPGEGRVWLSDEVIEGEMQKFSGTNKAGNHNEKEDFAGFTCDALAHWSLIVNEFERVFVDIQGEGLPEPLSLATNKSTGVVVKNMNALPQLYLFDVMFHTPDGSSGLGDQGQVGIDDFKKQHRCNRICRMLGLPVLTTPQEDEADPVESEDELLKK